MNDRRGIMSLPIKLAISFIIIGMALPPLVSMVEDLEEQRDLAELNDSCQELTDAMTRVYYSNAGDMTTFLMDVPSGGTLSVGGELPDCYAVRLLQDGNELGRVYLPNYAVAGDVLDITGSHYLKMRSVAENGTI